MTDSKAQPATPRPSGPGRPKDLGKRAAILEVAKRLFTQDGFDRVSMDQIATEAGVSKLTLYSHFGDKENLFAAAIRAKCEEQLPQALFLAGLSEGGLREQLTTIASALFALVCNDEAIAMHRMMINADIGDHHARELFWQAGPQQIKDAFAEFLRGRVNAGELAIEDIPRAASQFCCLVKGEPHTQMLCGMSGAPEPAEVQRHITATIDLFLRAYAAAEGSRNRAEQA